MNRLRWTVALMALPMLAPLAWWGLSGERAPVVSVAQTQGDAGVALVAGQVPARIACEARVDALLDAGDAANAPAINGMVLIPGGTFLMGSRPEVGEANEHPAQCVHVRAFRLDVNEVTVGAFREFWASGHPAFFSNEPVPLPGGQVRFSVGSRPRTPIAHDTAHPNCTWTPTAGTFEYYALNCVDWVTALAYCVERGARLPTEAEWEFAARGPEGRAWPWGNAFEHGGSENFCDGACASAHLGLRAMVGHDDSWPWVEGGVSLNPSASVFSVVQLGGNLSEWTMAPDPQRPLRVVRGGNWTDHDPLRVRAAARRGEDPSRQLDTLGFRCAQSFE